MQGGAMGRAIAADFARQGAFVCIADKNLAGAERLLDDVRSRGGDGMAGRIDARSFDEVCGFVQQVAAARGGVDVLVNTIGWNKQDAFVKNDVAFIDDILNINLRATIYFCRSVAPLMIGAARGRIINIASDAGRVGSSGDVVYSAAKAGVIGLTKALARELAAQRINVNCISPGPTESPLLEQSAREQPRLLEGLTRAIPWKRVARPEDIAAAVSFLASDGAEYITGQTLSVSGGLTMV
jgi:2-hydroxycyclohexanecarboxyl-CoA dehydrogenase